MSIFLSVVKAILILVSAALAYGFAYALYQAWRFRPKFEFDEKKVKKMFTLRDAVMKERWHSIERKFELGTPDAARIAVIEADALVDTALKAMSVEGEHLADRLSNLDPEEVTTINRVWRAHRMRNDLVHTPGFMLSPEDAKLAIDDYEAFLREIEML